MKTLQGVIAAVLLGSLSFGAMAAKEITREEATKYEKIGVVTTTDQATDPMDDKAQLSRLADEKGGKYFVVIEAREKGRFSATAEVYK